MTVDATEIIKKYLQQHKAFMATDIATEITNAETGLVDAPRLLETIFPNKACRPSLRWLRAQQERRTIPFMRIGRLIFFDPPRVREAIAARTITSKFHTPRRTTPLPQVMS